MPDYAYKAQHWKRVESAEQLLPLLDNVQRRGGWKGYQYTANPPCHASSSRASLSVGDAPEGGLLVKCWAGCDLDAIEDAVGMALNVRYGNGKLRYGSRDSGRRYGEPDLPASPHRAAPRRPRRPASQEPIYEVRSFSVADLRQANIWLALRPGGRPWTGNIGGVTYGYRPSLPDLGLSRYGGEYLADRDGEKYWIKLLAHTGYDALGKIIARIADKTGVQCRPGISMAASESLKYPFPLAAIDCDYDPERDTDGTGRQYRDALMGRCRAAGMPVYRSSGGNGFHALSGVNTAGRGYEEIRPDKYRDEHLTSAGWPSSEDNKEHRVERWTPPGTQGVAIDVFLPGARHSLTLRLDLPIAEVDGDLPMRSWRELNDLMVGDAASNGQANVGPAATGERAIRDDDGAYAASNGQANPAVDELLNEAAEQGTAGVNSGDAGLLEYCLNLLDIAEVQEPTAAQSERIARGRLALAGALGSLLPAADAAA